MPEPELILKQRLPQRLIRLRELHGFTQKALADAAGLAPSVINHLESGLALCTQVRTLILVAKPLAVSPDVLLGYDQDLTGEYTRLSIGMALKFGQLADQGWTVLMIAGLYGMSPGAVAKTLEDEYEVRRLRRR